MVLPLLKVSLLSIPSTAATPLPTSGTGLLSGQGQR
jgi:hypothetical protein